MFNSKGAQNVCTEPALPKVDSSYQCHLPLPVEFAAGEVPGERVEVEVVVSDQMRLIGLQTVDDQVIVVDVGQIHMSVVTVG